MRPVTLVTGGGGHLGGLLAGRLSRSPDTDVVVTVRPGRANGAHAGATLPVELGGTEPFAALDASLLNRVTSIVHAAAVIRFDVDPVDAQRVNVDGTRQVLDLAHRCPRLQMLAFVSSVYATGLQAGRIDEVPGEAPPGFANAYEWSKWAAERVVIEAGDAVPWTILRLPMVVADDASGTVSHANAFHRTLDLWFAGLLPVIPGDPATPLYVASARFVVEAMAAVVQRAAAARGVYHVSPDGTRAPTLAEVTQTVTAVFEADDAYRRRRVAPPLLTDLESFEMLASALGSLRTSVAGTALAALSPFARQLYVVKDLVAERLPAVLPDVRPDDPRLLVEATCEWLVRTRWGRRAVA